jgi:arginine utilization protein RocB
LIKLKEKAVRAFDNVIEKLNMEYRKYCELSNIPYKRLPWKTKVLTFQELYNEVKTEMGEKIDEITKQLATKLLEDDMDDREFSLKIVREVHKYYSDKDPIIVIYFAPPYYPHIYVRGNDEREQKLLAAVNRAVEETKRAFDYDIKIKKFYPYISDLSYCSITGEQSILSSLIGNMPAWPQKYSLPLKAIQKISMPVVNIGPYGKDAHKLTERLSVSYSLDAMPAILEKTIENLACSR